jgi:hypothetical protein
MLKRLLTPAAPAASAISLGRYWRGPEDFGERQSYGGERHILLFGPNGSGKGTRFLMPNLLQMQNCSLVVIDPKGELAAVTAPYRRTIGEVVIINPFGVLADRPGYADRCARSIRRRPPTTPMPRGWRKRWSRSRAAIRIGRARRASWSPA